MKLTDLIQFYTYFLAIQKCKKSSNYTIHGLWIDYHNRSYPQFCNMTDKFNLNELTELKDNLYKKWDGCYGNSEDLWEHEWDKHGTCFHPKMNLKYYFEKTLFLFDTKKDYIKEYCNTRECLIPIEYTEL